MEKANLPVSVYAEMTPNPAVLKFVANKRLVDHDALEFKNIDEAKPSPLAVRLFHFPFVKEIFISANYLSITKYDLVEWEEVTMELRELIRDFLAAGGEVYQGEAPTGPSRESGPEKAPQKANAPWAKLEKPRDQWDAIDVKIVSLLDEYVQPAVASDGGNIKFLSHQDGVVSVLLQGACSGCPSSTLTLKDGIERMLSEMLPGQIKAVQAVNG